MIIFPNLFTQKTVFTVSNANNNVMTSFFIRLLILDAFICIAKIRIS